MPQFLLDLMQVGKDLDLEYGGVLKLIAAVLVNAYVVWRIVKTSAKRTAGAVRWVVVAPVKPPKPEPVQSPPSALEEFTLALLAIDGNGICNKDVPSGGVERSVWAGPLTVRLREDETDVELNGVDICERFTEEEWPRIIGAAELAYTAVQEREFEQARAEAARQLQAALMPQQRVSENCKPVSLEERSHGRWTEGVPASPAEPIRKEIVMMRRVLEAALREREVGGCQGKTQAGK